MSANKESIITRVQKLLNLAMDEGATPDERRLAQDKADQLMVEHMIQQSELKKDDPARTRITHDVWSMKLSYEFRQDIMDLLYSVITHTKCRYTFKVDYADREQPHKVHIVGLPEQIAYAQRLWFIVFNEMAANLYPKWDSSKSLDANVYTFAKAGTKWREIHEIAWAAMGSESGLPDPYPADKQPSWNPKAVYGGDGGRLKRAYHREQKRLGEETVNHTNRHGAYRSSYISSYSSTIRQRLREMARKSQENLTVDERDRYALALNSTEAERDAEFYRLFPEYDPEVQRKQAAEAAAAEQARRAAMTDAERKAEDEKRKKNEAKARRIYSRMRAVKDTYDSNGWERGRKVAASVNLNDNKAAGDQKKEIR